MNPMVRPLRPTFVPYPIPAYQSQGSFQGSTYMPSMPAYQSQEGTYGRNKAGAQDDAMFLSAAGQWVGLPQPSGPLKTPPPGAAMVQVRLPAAYAQVLFDGKPTSTDGINRYFVTPELPEGKTYTYALSALWKNDGDDVMKERKIEVKAGHTTVVDFTRPDDKKSPKEPTSGGSY